MEDTVRYGVVFSGKEIVSVWGRPRYAVIPRRVFVPLPDHPKEEMEQILGLRVYGIITGYLCREEREALRLILISANEVFRRVSQTESGMYLLELSGCAPAGGVSGSSPFRTFCRPRHSVLHGTVCALEDGKGPDGSEAPAGAG